MPKLPIVSGKNLIKVMKERGYRIIRQKGSHVRMGHDDSRFKLITIPLHKEIKLYRLLGALKILFAQDNYQFNTKKFCLEDKKKIFSYPPFLSSFEEKILSVLCRGGASDGYFF